MKIVMKIATLIYMITMSTGDPDHDNDDDGVNGHLDFHNNEK